MDVPWENEMAVLKMTTRGEFGSRKARALRKKGLIPCIIYGHGEPALAVTVGEHEVNLAIHHGVRLLAIDVDGKEANVLIKDVQWDTFGQEVLHVDLTRVSLDERVSVTVPIVLRGTPAGVTEGGVVQQSTAEVNIQCLVRVIPEEIRVMVSGMQVGEFLFLRDLDLPEGATLLDDPNTRVCSVSVIEEEVEEAPPEEEAAEPEVIGETKEEAEGKGPSE